jgi:hypothetical protein
VERAINGKDGLWAHATPRCASKLFLYEHPFIVDASHPPIPDSLRNDIGDAVAANRRGEAVALFFQNGMGHSCGRRYLILSTGS